MNLRYCVDAESLSCLQARKASEVHSIHERCHTVPQMQHNRRRNVRCECREPRWPLTTVGTRRPTWRCGAKGTVPLQLAVISMCAYRMHCGQSQEERGPALQQPVWLGDHCGTKAETLRRRRGDDTRIRAQKKQLLLACADGVFLLGSIDIVAALLLARLQRGVMADTHLKNEQCKPQNTTRATSFNTTSVAQVVTLGRRLAEHRG